MKTPKLDRIGQSAMLKRLVSLLGCGLFVGFLSGCLSRPALHNENFALQSPPLTAIGTNAQIVLSLLPVQVSAQFDRRSFTYRTGPEAYELDPYAAFLVPPSRAISIPMRAYLLNSRFFKDVIEPGSPVRPGEILDVYVTELYGDFQKADAPEAVMTLRIHLFTTQNHETLLVKNYSSRIPLKARTAAALAASWSQALEKIMNQMNNDLATIPLSP